MTWLVTQMFPLCLTVVTKRPRRVNWEAKPVAVHENIHGNTNLANTELKSNNILSAHIVERRKDGFIDGLTHMMSEIITLILLQKRMNQGDHTCLRVTTAFLNSPKPSTTGDRNQDLLVK